MIRPAAVSDTAARVLKSFPAERAACFTSGHLFRRQSGRGIRCPPPGVATLAVNISCAALGELATMAAGGNGKDGGRDLDG
jgi:hypothetical protein